MLPGQRLEDSVHRFGGVRLGQGLVLGAERQREGYALHPVGDGRALVDVEQRGGFEILPARAPDGLFQRGNGCVNGADEGEIAGDGGEAGQGAEGRLRLLQAAHRGDIELGVERVVSELIAVAHEGVYLSDHADALAAGGDIGAASGMERGVVPPGGVFHVSDPHIPEDRLDAALELEEVGAAAVFAEGQPNGFVGKAVVYARAVDRRHLIEADDRVPARRVGGKHVQHGGHRGGAHDAAVLAEGVLDGEGAAQRRILGQADPVPGAAAAEGVGEDLIEAHGAAEARHTVFKALLFAPAALGGLAAEHRGLDHVVAVEAGDLLRQVGIMLDVRAPGGDDHAVAVHREAERGEDGDHILPREIGTEKTVYALNVKVHSLLFGGRGLHVDHAVDHLTGAEQLYELAGALDGGDGPFGIEPLFEFGGGVGTHTQGDGGLADGGAVEVCGLKHDSGGAVRDLGVLAAHDAGKTDGLFRVGDHEHARIDGALDAVEGGERLARLGAAHDDPVSADARVVKGVHGLAVFLHDIVRDIDDVVDRADTGGAQTAAQPRGGGLDLYVFDHPRRIARAESGVPDLHGEVVFDGIAVARALYLGRVQAEICAEGRRGFSCQTDDAQAVGAVVRDLEFHHAVGQTQDLPDVVAGPAGLLQDEDAVLDGIGIVVGVETELAEGAEHTLARHAAQLAGTDLLAAGERGAVQRHGDHVADGDVLRAGDDGELMLLSRVDRADPQVIGVGVPFHGKDAPDRDVFDALAGAGECFDLGAGHGHAVAELLVGYGDARVIAEPFA